MNAVGIDVSKGKSMITVMRPGKEVVIEPFEVSHTDSELIDLAKVIQSLDGETRVVMEATGNYHLPIAWMLHDAGIYVSVVNAMLIRNYGNNTIRKGKTDKKDAQKIANYAIDNWTELPAVLSRRRCSDDAEELLPSVRTLLQNSDNDEKQPHFPSGCYFSRCKPPV